MRETDIRRLIGLTMMVLVIAVIPGCTPGVDGDYKDANGLATVGLHGGKATVKMIGMTLDGEYKVDGDKVTITRQGEQPIVFTRASDGSLESNNQELSRK